MNTFIDVILDKVTMYRLVVYVLLVLLGIAIILGFAHVIPYSPFAIISSTLLLTATSWCMNKYIASVFEAPTNVESVYITALILALIVSPAKSFADVLFLIWVGIAAMASKYILAIREKHIFNPAAIAVVLTGIATIGSASWWVGTAWLVPFVIIGGYLIIRKLQFEDMIWSYLSVAILVSLAYTIFQEGNVLITLKELLLSSPLFFLGGIMLTEPLTSPTSKKHKMIYGALVGLLSVPFVHIGSLSFTPELALVIGNIFAYLVSPKQKLIVTLQDKIQVSSNIIDFIFIPKQKPVYIPGQYVEWTLPHTNTDSRGNRRYFTLASSPTEENIRLGVRFNPDSSSYKKALQMLNTLTPMVGTQISGEFTLPKDRNKKLVFIAGGIGITPFRSMIKYLLDTNQKRDIIIFYSSKTPDEFAYKDIFAQAQVELGIKTVYTITDTKELFPQWNQYVGRITEDMIRVEVPDYLERSFYLSGPHSMVVGYEKVLKSIGIADVNIKKDFFPGLV